MKIETDCKLNDWISKLPLHLKRIPLIYLAIPGSHNTFTYSLSRFSSVSPDSPKYVKILSYLFKPIANPIIYAYSRTQSLDIVQQLNIGIRYLDIRLVNRDDSFYVAHGLYGGVLTPFLNDINEFLTSNPSEIVILDFQHFYEFCNEHHEKLIRTLSNIFQEKILHSTCHISRVSVEYCQAARAQVVVIYRNSLGCSSSLLWPSLVWPTKWPDKIKVVDLIYYLDNELNTRITEKGLVTQFLLTVNFSYVLKHICSSLKSLAALTNRSLAPWMKNKYPGPRGVNVIICDFVDTNFTTNVIQLNYKENNLFCN